MTKKSDKEFFEKAGKDADAKVSADEEQAAARWWNFEGKGGEEAFPNFEGHFVSCEIKEKTGDNGSYTCLLVYVRDLKDELFKAWFSAGAAVRGMKEAAPAVGSLTMIRYEGQKQSNTSDRKFKAYTVVTDKQDRELWNSYQKAFDSRSVGVQQFKPIVSLSPDEAPF